MSILKGGKYSYVAVFTANIIGFISGTALTWSSPVIPKLTSNHTSDIPFGRKITDDEESWIGSLTALGGVFGPFVFVFLLNRIGRKLSVMALAVPFLVGFLMAAFAKQVPLYYVARFLMGVGIGGTFGVVPVYIVEVVEDSNRGILTSTTTGCILGGALFSYILGPYVSITVFNLVLAVITVAFVPVFFFFGPETPYYLMRGNNVEKAKESLRYLRRKPSNIIELEVEKIRSHLNELEEGSVFDIFSTKGSRKAFMLSVVLTTLQQLSGINVIMFYSQNIFQATGNDIPAEICSIIIGSVQFGTCYITPLLSDRLGRKKLLYISATGAIVSETVLGLYFYFQKNDFDVSSFSWLPITSLVAFILSYNFGISSLPWGMMSELLPLNVIEVASSAVSSIYWISGFLLTKYFASVSHDIGMGPSFWIFAGCCAVLNLFVYCFVFELKGKSLREIQEILNS